MKSLLCIMMMFVSLSFPICTASAAEDQSAVEMKDDTSAVKTVDSESADTVNVVAKEKEDTPSVEPAASVEKPAAVQTASWGEIKRIFKDR